MSGSLHCVGMCGGLVTASCSSNSEIIRYQAGRLLGYLFLGLMGGALGSVLQLNEASPYLGLLTGLLMGGLFIFWGLKNFKGERPHLHLPGILGRTYGYLYKQMVSPHQGFSRSFFTGLISIFLPCGLLYGIVISTVALEGTGLALTSMFFFWLGTVPGMVLAPGIVRKVLWPLKKRLPKFYAMGLICLGILTIGVRVSHLNFKGEKASAPVHHCH